MNKIIGKSNPKLCASVICANLLNIKRDLDILEEEGFDYLHFDIMDGHFVPRLGLDLNLLRQITKTYSLPVEVHLMVDNPSKYIEEVIKASASAVVFHLEAEMNINNIIYSIKKYKNIKIGLALKPETPINIIIPYLDLIDIILLMAYPPGTFGEKPINSFSDRIKNLKKLLVKYKKENIDIAIDGGVTIKNLKSYLDSGVSMFIFGTAGLFIEGIDIRDQIKLIKKTLNIV
ncbi:MAG: ribulose-phosphate 3-epimerase [Candidatus Humimicrobiaceae bacterium]